MGKKPASKPEPKKFTVTAKGKKVDTAAPITKKPKEKAVKVAKKPVEVKKAAATPVKKQKVPPKKAEKAKAP